MKLFRLTFIFSLFFSIAHAQQWNWAHVAAGGSSIERNILVAKADSGEFFITGEFQQTQTFGSYSLTPVGNKDVFVAKYDKDGACLWAINGGGNFSDNDATGIATDNSGNVYIGGNFTNQIVFGGYTLNLGANQTNSFIAKFDQAGNCQFLKPLYTKGATQLKNLERDGSGNFLITGYIYDSTYFDAIGMTSAPGANVDIYLAKFDPAGNYLWVKRAGGNSEDVGYKISSDNNGNIYLGGVFKQTATFGTNTVTSFGDFDMFVAKFDNNGNNLWVKGGGGTSADQTYGLSNDAAGNTYVTGFYYPTPVGMSTAPAHFGPFLLTDNGAGNMFIAKLDSAGTFVWANKGGGSQHDEGYSISTDANGNSFVTGVFFGTASFGGFTLVSGGGGDAFILKYNTAGAGLLAQKIGGMGSEFGKSIVSYSNGDCIVAGNFSGSVTVNCTPPATLNASGGYRVFIVKFSGGSVGIQDSENENKITSLYPNPAQESITLTLHNAAPQNYHFDIVDAYGRLVQSYDNLLPSGLNDVKFSTATLEPGNYFIRMIQDQQIKQQKFIIIR